MTERDEKQTCSLLLFVATSSEEKAVYEAARARGLQPERVRSDLLGEYRWLRQVGDERVIVVRAESMGPHGHGGSAELALRYKWLTGATAIVQVGMAFRVAPQDSLQRYGDVLVSSSLIPYDNRDVVPDGDGKYRVDYSRAAWQRASETLLAMFLRERDRGGYAHGIHFGALLSGGAHIRTRIFRDELVASAPAGDAPIVGGEMEGVGLLGADDAPVWCIVKGIIDFADEDRDAVYKVNRPVACRNAAEFVFNALINDAKGLSSAESRSK